MAYTSICWLYLFFTFNGIIQLHSTTQWGDKQLFPSNNIPDDGLSPRRSVVKRKIVLYHNFFRTKVRPTAANMLLMSWHPLAAQQAQAYAEKCIFLQHNDAEEKIVPYLGSCGQNLFVSSNKTPWFFAIKSWFLEYQNYTYGAPVHNLKAVGHYTQMVWATSYKVGCGVARCSGGPWGQFYNYVCHYCPGGNYQTIVQYPYKAGQPCDDCPNDCIASSLCTNYCPVTDFYSNCDALAKMPGYCERGTCNATCACGNEKIHKKYPW